MNYTNIIAGPCSIESREQFFETCDWLSVLGFKNIRGGVWKPRTKPGGFEGLGEIALKWMQEYKTISPKTKMYCEIANKDQLDLAVKYNIDGIWIGARTTVDPFAVQEIADELRSLISNNLLEDDFIVMVKNPVCPDLDLWEGAIQRIYNTGINKDNVIAIHRGFKVYEPTKYRNEPLWRIPLELKTKYPDLKIYVDPSHISGNKEYVKDIINTGINTYNFDGLIVESHWKPEVAWTDAAQQVNPKELYDIINDIYKPNKVAAFNTTSELDSYRKEIDSCDLKLLNMLYNRLEISKKIGAYKKKNNMKTYQNARWHDLLSNITRIAESEYGLDKNYVQDIWQIIHEESIKVQN